MAKHTDNSNQETDLDINSNNQTRRNLEDTVQFTTDDLERERERYMTDEEHGRYVQRREQRRNLDDDYFDRESRVYETFEDETSNDQLSHVADSLKFNEQERNEFRYQPAKEREFSEQVEQERQKQAEFEQYRKEYQKNKQDETEDDTVEQSEELHPRSSFLRSFQSKSKNTFNNVKRAFARKKEDVSQIKEEFQQEESLTQESKDASTSPVKEQKPVVDVNPVHVAETDKQVEELEEENIVAETDAKQPTFQQDEKVEHSEKTESQEREEDSQSVDLEELDQEELDELSDKVSKETNEFSDPLVTDQVLKEATVSDQLLLNDANTFESLEKDLAEIKHPDASFDEQSSDNSFVGGAAWLTAGSILSRVLGALYVIPWAMWLGEEFTQANTLMSVGYKPYSLFLAIATAGFPSAIAKQMAYYHSMKEYKVADRLFKYSLGIMLVTGIISGGLLFASAPVLAEQSPTVNPEGATLVIRTLVPALLILPIMSLLRGYFQGFNDMKPTAISQILEQFARVVYLLTATYAIMQIYSGSVTEAVAHSTFAAFIGALVSLAYLVFVYIRRLPVINQLKERSLDKVKIDFSQSLRIMIVDSIPFILLGSGIIIAQLIDTYTFSQIMESTSSLLLIEIDELYGVLSHDVDKLMMIIISLAVAIATSAVPIVTSTYASGDIQASSELVRKIITVFTFVMIPAALGMASIADNVYHFFYAEGSEAGPALLVTGSISSIALGAYTVFSTVLQSMNFRRLAVRYLIVGILVKLIAQYPFVAILQAHGALLATMFGFTIASILMWFEMNRHLSFDYTKLKRDIVQIIATAIVMVAVVTLWNFALNQLFGPVGRGLTLLKIVLTVSIGAFVYLFGMGIQGKLYILLGDRYHGLQERLRMF